MGSWCCKLFQKQRTDENYQRENIVDLREDHLQFPVQVADTEDSQLAPTVGETIHNDGLAGDFIDLREDYVLDLPIFSARELSQPIVARCDT